MKRLFVLFIVLALPCGAVFSQKKDTYHVRTVVIDPGHGGAKPGAQGSRSWEKDITLSVAKKFGQLIKDNYPDVKLIYTRTTDVDISLAERARIANRNKADLFISIHANSHPTSAPTGVETFVMGLSESKANLEVAKKENADILLEADYQNNADYSGFDPNAPETYVMLAMFQNAFIDKSLNFAQAIQNQYKQNLKTINRGVKQAELYVLYKTTCPSVLTEIGFISNPAEEAFMLSDEGQAKIAVSLFRAFMNYKSSEEGIAKLTNPVINLKGYGEQPKAVETPKEEPKAEPVKEEPKAEPVKEEPKVEPVKEEPKAEAPAPEPVPEKAPDAVKVAEVTTPVAPAEKKPTPAVELPAVQQPAPAPQPETKPAAKPEAKPEVKPQPKPEVKPEPKPQVKPQAKPEVKPATQPRAIGTGVIYRVQFSSSTRQFKAGDPELQGIKDIHSIQNGKYYVYSAGDYRTLQEARQRCKKIKESTTFRDAFVIAIYRGERISLEKAAQIESQTKKN
ncbi:MAG: N-acetylmuramoyl-L-alanine amidase [Bacteroidales bacterium]|nr:N-acetylmuramoyl-L-alanine amidase [Bacteroidales bacterium]